MGSAVQAGSGLNTEGGIENGGCIMHVVVVKSQARDRDAGASLAAENLDAGAVVQSGEQLVEQQQFVVSELFGPGGLDGPDSFEEGCETSDIEIAGFETMGVSGWLLFGCGFRPGPALPQGLHGCGDAARHEQEGGAERTEKSFVTGCGEEIAIQLADVERHTARGLGCVDEEVDPRRPAD